MKAIHTTREQERQQVHSTHRQMNVDEGVIRSLCTDAVFERGQKYRDEEHIQRVERFDDVCPYRGAGECKHVVAVLREVVDDPPGEE